MVAMLLLAIALVMFLGSFLQSRRVTEASVLHAAASSLVYGLLEQMKGIDYTSLPNRDPADPTAPWQITLRVSQANADRAVPLTVVYTKASTPSAPTVPQAPLTTPAPAATAASVGAIENTIGPFPLSSTSGTQSQRLQLSLWIWVDEIPDVNRDVKEVKKITVVYTYKFNDGQRTKTVRDREVILRTRFDQ
jgi:hypothetical protein